MKNQLRIALGALFLSSVFIISPESFTKKKNKLPSSNTLKADCGYSCGDVLESMANMQEEMAKLQRELLKKSRELVEGENKSFFATAKKEQLQECVDKLTAFEQKTVAFKKELEAITQYVKSLKD